MPNLATLRSIHSISWRRPFQKGEPIWTLDFVFLFGDVFLRIFLNQVKSPCKEPPFGRICLELLPFRRHFKQTQLDVFCFSTGSLTLNFDPPIGTHISFMFRGYNPYWGFKTFIFLWCWGPRELFTCLENIGFRTIFLLGNWKYLVLGVSS